jgi:hypothetical protein
MPGPTKTVYNYDRFKIAREKKTAVIRITMR